MAYKVYPVVGKYLECDDYEVKINGKKVETNTARVSAIPFNAPWPGHQRQIDQTEIVQFISLENDEKLDFEITPKHNFSSVKIRPKSLGIVPIIENDKIYFTLDNPAYFTVEAYGRNNALHIFADPIFNYNTDKNDENVLYFGKGIHDVGVIEMQSNQTIFIDKGALVFASIKATNCENIKIIGRGILDNSKNKEIIISDIKQEKRSDGYLNNAIRTHAIQFNFCNNITVDGITIRDSLVYNIRPVCCSDIKIYNVKLIGNWRYNSDGFDMHNCINVHIKHCFCRTFDDSICIKGGDYDLIDQIGDDLIYNGKKYDIFKNVLVEDCVIWNDWGKALEIGAETRATEICNITFRNCDIIHVNHTVLDCLNCHTADVHDLLYKNINIECDEVILPPIIQKNDDDKYVNPDPNYMPPTIAASVLYYPPYSLDYEKTTGRNRRLTYENINLIGDKPPKCKFIGLDSEHMVEDVSIINLMWNDVPVDKVEEKNWIVNEFIKNITFEINPYTQLSKNTVKADDQLERNTNIRFFGDKKDGVKIMFVGNSITLHGILPEIGWYNECGMAASSVENDYVHIIKKELENSDINANYCICQVSNWERQYKNGEEILSDYMQARDYDADIIIVRFLENCPSKDFDGNIFIKQMDKLLTYLNKSNKAKFIFTTGFFNHPAQNYMIEYAKNKGQKCILLSDLGEIDEMKAIGKFKHSGVANHPGDLGMKNIADRILIKLKEIL